MDNKIMAERREKAETLRELGHNPYANDFKVTDLAANLHAAHGETTGEGWAERVVVVEKELWWKNADTASGMEGIGSSRSDVCDDDASASEEEEDEGNDASAAAGAAHGKSQEEWEAPDSAAEGEEDDDPGDLSATWLLWSATRAGPYFHSHIPLPALWFSCVYCNR